MTIQGVTIDVYGTWNFDAGGFTVNGGSALPSTVNIQPGGSWVSSIRGVNGTVVINNDGDINFNSMSSVTFGGSTGSQFNNTGTVDATMAGDFVFQAPIDIDNSGTMNFANFENNEADPFINTGIITIERYFFNHGTLINEGTIQTVCGEFGVDPRGFVVAIKAPENAL